MCNLYIAVYCMRCISLEKYLPYNYGSVVPCNPYLWAKFLRNTFSLFLGSDIKFAFGYPIWKRTQYFWIWPLHLLGQNNGDYTPMWVVFLHYGYHFMYGSINFRPWSSISTMAYSCITRSYVWMRYRRNGWYMCCCQIYL